MSTTSFSKGERLFMAGVKRACDFKARSDLGGPEGRLSIEESVPGVVNELLAKQGRPGLEYLEYRDRTGRW